MWPFKKKHPIRIGASYPQKNGPPWAHEVTVIDYSPGWVKYKFLHDGRPGVGTYSDRESTFRYLYEVTA